MAIAERTLRVEQLPDPAPEPDAENEPNEGLLWLRSHLAWERRLDALQKEHEQA